MKYFTTNFGQLESRVFSVNNYFCIVRKLFNKRTADFTQLTNTLRTYKEQNRNEVISTTE